MRLYKKRSITVHDTIDKIQATEDLHNQRVKIEIRKLIIFFTMLPITVFGQSYRKVNSQSMQILVSLC